MHIQISYDDGIAQDTKIEEVIQKVCDEVSRVYGLEDDELSILLCDNKKIHELNKEYRGIDRPTDVLSFALNEGDDYEGSEEEHHLLGDMILSLERAHEQAIEYGHSFERELAYLTTHSCLHILGYDHMNDEDKKEMRTEEGQQKAAAICKKYGIQGLVVIGGDGSFAGAQKLSNLGINTIGIPGTIDLDIACTEYTIGFDTAVNTAMEAIDKVRDTSTSHERCSVIEVMGRDAGYLALWCGIANGAERILMPEEHDYDEEKIIADIIGNRKRGKQHYIIINAEGIGDSMNMAKRIEEATGMETRATILGHMQRGGSPTCKDRVYASIMGAKAVDLLLEGKTNRVVGYQHGEFVDYDINEALQMHKEIPEYAYRVSKDLAL